MWKQSFAAVGQITLLIVCAGCNQAANTETAEPAVDPAVETEATDPASQPPAVVERVKAGVGVGKKGRSLDEFDSGIQRMIAQPAKAFFATSERVIFDIQIPQALQLFKATEGRLPRSHEEFMSRIVQPNNIRLPELSEGQEYEFDPEAGELMVKRPG